MICILPRFVGSGNRQVGRLRFKKKKKKSDRKSLVRRASESVCVVLLLFVCTYRLTGVCQTGWLSTTPRLAAYKRLEPLSSKTLMSAFDMVVDASCRQLSPHVVNYSYNTLLSAAIYPNRWLPILLATFLSLSMSVI